MEMAEEGYNPMSVVIVVVSLVIGVCALLSVTVVRRVVSERQLQHTLGSLRSLGEQMTNPALPVETLGPMPVHQELRP
jgi:hypothetical protein